MTGRCFACDSDRVSVLRGVRDVHAGTGRSYDLAACDACGSTRLLQLPSEAELAALYPDTYYSYAGEEKPPLWRRLLGVMHDRHRFKPTFARLLEVGCGAGDFLATIRDRGETVGLEHTEAAHHAALRRGLDVRVGDVTDATSFEPASFDYVYLNHAFEHLADPDAALASIARWLAPGGRLFIGVPNRQGLVARIFGKNWYYIAPPIHITNSTPAGLTRLLERHGFEVERIEYNSDPCSLPMSASIALGGDIFKKTLLQKALIGLGILPAWPLAKLLDAMRAGDCIELHARKRTGGAA